jgi:UDP-N-acetylglucosamine/UDP-N-acetylgalactosamine diphosphorylase
MSASEEKEEEVRVRYESTGQGHVLKYLPQLSQDEKSSLLSQLANIEVEKLSDFLQAALNEQSQTATTGEISPFSKSIARTTDESSREVLEPARETGLTALRKGQVAALVLAGGQGTRLGFNGPKGMYNIGLSSRRTLFQLIVERLRRLGQLAAATDDANDDDHVQSGVVEVPFYIMTSPLNHEETISYFQNNSYFGMKASDVQFFCQGMLPCLTDEGKIIMESPSRVAMAPDGNGGIYPSLVKSGMLDDMTRRGIEYLHVFSIDNALVKPADPVFIGYCISQGADCGNKVLWKSHAHEKVGVLAEKDGKPCIVEYSDISTEMAERTDQDGRLVFGAGNICNHFYTLDFIRDVIVPNLGNMYHIAKKKIPYYNEKMSETVTPTSNNGMKLESFIFDVFPLSKSMAVLDVSHDEEFAPVKNAPGSASDSPDTAREMISTLAKKWVKAAGGNLAGDLDSTCEVSPLVSYSGEGLTDIVKDKDIVCPFSL